MSHGAIDRFFSHIQAQVDGYPDPVFSFIGIRSSTETKILASRLFFETEEVGVVTADFEYGNIRAGLWRLSEMGISPEELIAYIYSGKYDARELLFSQAPGQVEYIELHPEGLKNQNRLSVLRIKGGSTRWLYDSATIDWELRAAPVPYDSLQELAFAFRVSPLEDNAYFEAIAFNVAAVDGRSTVEGTTASLLVRVAERLDPKAAGLGYRVFSGRSVVARGSIEGEAMTWAMQGRVQVGAASLEVNEGALIQCYAKYAGRVQHSWWVAAPGVYPNSRRTMHELFDSSFDILKEFLAGEGKGKSRDFEVGVSWLLWLLGFNVAHLGAIPRTQEAPDLLATSPSGHVVVIECTTGTLKSDNKLALLVSRATNIQGWLQRSGHSHLRVIPAIITAKPRAEVAADLEQAEKMGVLVLAKEELEAGLNRTLVAPNVDELIEQAESEIRAAKERHARPDAISEPQLL